MYAQPGNWQLLPPDSLKDLSDVAHQISHSGAGSEKPERKKSRTEIGIFPAVGYTLQTGFAAVISGNIVIYQKHHGLTDSTRFPSSIFTSISYSQKKQVILPFQSALFFNKNHMILLSDWKYLRYPSYTYGLGMNTSPEDSSFLNYQYLKFHQSVLFEVMPHVFLGAGYALDFFWKIKEVYPKESASDFEKYGLKESSVSSGITFHLIRDTRDNAINAFRGSFINLIIGPRFTFLGSDANWTSLIFEYRKFLRLPRQSNNILAFWTYNWFTLAGHPPYLNLPNTGWDFPTGRGYIQSRFRSNNMLDAEAEYRIQLSRNGLFGINLYSNLQSFTDINTWKFGNPAPGAGLGLRIKLNKYSRTNISVDYGFGRQGSSGFFVNLGEVF